MRASRLVSLTVLALAAVGCTAQGDSVESGNSIAAPAGNGRPFQVEEVARFNEPWAMTFLPGGHALVTEKSGKLMLLRRTAAPRSRSPACLRSIMAARAASATSSSTRNSPATASSI